MAFATRTVNKSFSTYWPKSPNVLFSDSTFVQRAVADMTSDKPNQVQTKADSSALQTLAVSSLLILTLM